MCFPGGRGCPEFSLTEYIYIIEMFICAGTRQTVTDISRHRRVSAETKDDLRRQKHKREGDTMRMKKPELKAVKFQENRDVIATSAAALDWSILTISGLNGDGNNFDNTVTIGNKSMHYGETYKGKEDLDAIYQFVFDNYDKFGVGYVTEAGKLGGVNFINKNNNSNYDTILYYFDFDEYSWLKGFNGSYRYQQNPANDRYMFMPVTN